MVSVSRLVRLTGGAGWGVEEAMQKATMLNMPLAIAVAASWQLGEILFSVFTRLLAHTPA